MNISGLNFQLSAPLPQAAPKPPGDGALQARENGAPSQVAASDATTPTAEEQAQLRALKIRDREVRQHEQAHLAAAGGLATSGANFTYQRGPDGVNYAIGGEVSIDTSAGSTPEETLRRARIIQAAAQAPADPSSQDQAVAAKGAQMARQAQAELAQENAPPAEAPPPGNFRAALQRLYAPAPSGGNSLDIFV